MRRLILAYVLTVIALSSAAETIPRDWTDAPKGISITEVTLLPEGFGVRFETDLPPPYRVGVHVPEEVGLAARAYPVAYIDTDAHYAVVTGRFLNVALFIQVYKTSPSVTPEWTRMMNGVEWDAYVKRIRNRPPRTIPKPDYYGNPEDRSLDGIDSPQFVLVDDDVWGCFIRTNATELTLNLHEITRAPQPEYVLTTNTVPLHLTGLDPSLGGCGYRILAFTFGETRDLIVQNAYSVQTNMSQEVLVKRGWRSLSSNGEWKFTTDWEGSRVFVPCTNAVPYRIYGRGL